MSQNTSRRTFVKFIGAAGLLPVVLPRLARAESANNKLNIAFIGIGGKGSEHVGRLHGFGENCPCFVDIDKTHWDHPLKKKGWEKATGYQDYRKMFDAQSKEIDAVIVATPDHHHFPAAMIALQHDKHVYCQKPLTWSVWEARTLAAEAAKRKVATQMGNQGHAGEGWRMLVEWIQAGAIGDVTEVHNWTNRPIWPQGIPRPAGEDKVPAHLDWENWIGPAPMRPFKSGVYHGFNWRGWFDFGAGALGDMACHTMDGMFWSLTPDAPTSIEVLSNTGHTGDCYPSGSTIKWTFGAKGTRPAFNAFWYDGIKPGSNGAWNQPALPEELVAEKRQFPRTGNLYIGTKGKILIAGDYGDSPRLIPEAKMQEIGKPKRVLERAPQIGSMEDNHTMEFVMAAKGTKPLDFPKSNFSYAGPMTETIQLGNVALRVQCLKDAPKKLDYDGASMKFTNFDDANQFIKREPRDGWKVV